MAFFRRGRRGRRGRGQRFPGPSTGAETQCPPDRAFTPSNVDPQTQNQATPSTLLGKRPLEVGADSDRSAPQAERRDETEGEALDANTQAQQPDQVGESELTPAEKKAKLDDEKAGSSFCADTVDREEGFSLDREGAAESGNRRSERREKFGDSRWALLEPVLDRETRTLNVNMIQAHRSNRHFYCILCTAKLNNSDSLVKHVVGIEHERRARMFINWTKNMEAHPFFCKMCVASCTCQEMLNDHLMGKKHVKTASMLQSLQREEYFPIAPQLLGRLLSGPPVKKVGDGLTLGLSPTMMRFFSLSGPFIGLQYAEEIGKEGDPGPRYFCHLCKLHMDYNNAGLHFTSTAHRHNVLEQDYPDKLANTPRTGAKRDTERCATLAAEIEASEGRKVELIKRKIIREDWNPGQAVPHSSSWGIERGRGRGGWVERGRGRGSGLDRGRGRGGYGTTGGTGEMEEWPSGGMGRGGYDQQGGVGWMGGGRGRGGFGKEQRGGFGRGDHGGLGRGERGGFGGVSWRGGGRGRVDFGEGQRGGFGQGYRGGLGRGERGGLGRGERCGFGQERGGFGHGERGKGFGRGGFGRGERGGYRQGEGIRGVRGQRGRGRGQNWGAILSQAYRGNSSYGNQATTSAASWRESNQSGSYDDDSYDNNFHGDDSSFHDDSDNYWSEETEWNDPQVKLEYESHDIAHVWQGTRGGQRGRGRGRDARANFPSSPLNIRPFHQDDHQSTWGAGDFQQPPQNRPPGPGALPSPTRPPPHSYTPHSNQDVHATRHQSQFQVSPSLPQQQPMPSKADIFRNLALSSVENEEDAEMALQLSSTLTQALLAYRLKNVSTTNPLNEVLSAVQGTSLPEP